MPKLDDMNWHLDGGEFPPDLPEESAATHIGFFVAWAINNGLWNTSVLRKASAKAMVAFLVGGLAGPEKIEKFKGHTQ